MRHPLITKLIVFLLITPLSINSALSSNIDNHLSSTKFEEILNKKKHDLLKDLFQQKSFKQFDKEYINFSKTYKDAQWSIKTISNNSNERVLDVNITSTRKIGSEIYNLNSQQTVKLKMLKNKIKSYKVINEQSILHSQNSPLSVKVISPNKVLTGERYEINLIIEKPLDDSLIASGMIVVKNNENIKISNNQFGIKPNQSGGLFKYIQAPLEPGFQTISAIITHQKGIYSITKKIKIGF